LHGKLRERLLGGRKRKLEDNVKIASKGLSYGGVDGIRLAECGDFVTAAVSSGAVAWRRV
jgi:hypothetical protein